MLVWLLAAALVWQRAGLGRRRLPPRLVRLCVWALVGLTFLSSVLNFASSSQWERYLWGPFGLVLAVLCLVVARAPEPVGPGGDRKVEHGNVEGRGEE